MVLPTTLCDDSAKSAAKSELVVLVDHVQISHADKSSMSRAECKHVVAPRNLRAFDVTDNVT